MVGDTTHNRDEIPDLQCDNGNKDVIDQRHASRARYRDCRGTQSNYDRERNEKEDEPEEQPASEANCDKNGAGDHRKFPASFVEKATLAPLANLEAVCWPQTGTPNEFSNKH
jgi:hypothetical protein